MERQQEIKNKGTKEITEKKNILIMPHYQLPVSYIPRTFSKFFGW
jgi:hypothetical protein